MALSSPNHGEKTLSTDGIFRGNHRLRVNNSRATPLSAPLSGSQKRDGTNGTTGMGVVGPVYFYSICIYIYTHKNLYICTYISIYMLTYC